MMPSAPHVPVSPRRRRASQRQLGRAAAPRAAVPRSAAALLAHLGSAALLAGAGLAAAARPEPSRPVAAGGRGLTAWTGGTPVTWGGDAVPAMAACFNASTVDVLPTVASFLGYEAGAAVTYQAPAVPLYGASDALLAAGPVAQARAVRAIFADASRTARLADDAPRAAALLSILVNMPQELATALSARADGTIAFTAEFLGDISQPPVAQDAALDAALPTDGAGDIAGYGALDAALAPQFRKMALAINACQNGDLYCVSAADTLGLVLGQARYDEIAVGGGIRDALYAAYVHGGNTAVAGTLRFTGDAAAAAGSALRFALSGSLLRVTSSDTNRVMDLTLRTDAPYALLSATFDGRNEYVTLGNVMATNDTDVRRTSGDIFTAAADTLIFNVPTSLLDDLGVWPALAQRA